jgi:hypothetical protein
VNPGSALLTRPFLPARQYVSQAMRFEFGFTHASDSDAPFCITDKQKKRREGQHYVRSSHGPAWRHDTWSLRASHILLRFLGPSMCLVLVPWPVL